jgi:phosphoketolase
MHANAKTLTPDLLQKMNAYWRAANYLSVGQIYLYDNPLLKEPLKLSHVKPLVVGHWGTTPGQNFIYVHLNRVIKKYDLDMFYVAGPGHGGPAIATSHKTKPGCKNSSSSFPFPVEFRAMSRLQRRARFMKAANSAIRSVMLSEQRSIIRS